MPWFHSVTSAIRSLRDRLGLMTSRWYILAVVLVTSLVLCSNLYLRDYVLFDVDKSTEIVLSGKRTSRHRQMPSGLRKTISRISKSCPLEYLKERWGDHRSGEQAVWNKLTATLRHWGNPGSPGNQGNQGNHSAHNISSSSPHHSEYTSNYPILNIPTEFNTSFLNPCWYVEGELRCLPYFFLAGFPKCGTTDLYFKMGLHPQIRVGNRKEPHWWTRRRLGRALDGSRDPSKAQPLSTYLNLYSDAARCMSEASRLRLPKPVPLVTGDGSASTFWDNRLLLTPLGEEPQGVQADDIRHYLPQAKIIVIMRDPIQRLFSDYVYFWKSGDGKTSPSGEDFHEKVRETVTMVTECMKNDTLRRCVYTGAIRPKVRLRVGMYSVYLRDWYRVFPRHQIHVVRTEDYSASPRTELQKIFTFLGLDALDESIYSQIETLPRTNKQSKHLDMLSKTRVLLGKFYSPFNKDLAELLGNTDYLWEVNTTVS